MADTAKEPAVTEARGADSLSRGLRALQEVGPGEGETLEEWAHRIGDGCGWGEDRGAPLATELTRITRVWVERGYILKNDPPVSPSHTAAPSYRPGSTLSPP